MVEWSDKSLSDLFTLSSIIEENFKASANDKGYNHRPLDLPNIQSNSVNFEASGPYLFKNTLDNTSPFGKSEGDLKEHYLTREQLYARTVSPVITQEQLIKKIK